MGGFLEGKRGARDRGVRINDHNKKDHFCAAHADIFWALMEKR